MDPLGWGTRLYHVSRVRYTVLGNGVDRNPSLTLTRYAAGPIVHDTLLVPLRVEVSRCLQMIIEALVHVDHDCPTFVILS